MPFYRYSLWDGTQEIFHVHEEDLMEQLSDELVTHGDISNALKSIAQSGLRGKFSENTQGVQDMLQRLRSMKQQALDKYNLDHILDDIAQKLDDIVRTERTGIDNRVADVRSRFLSPMDGGTTPPSIKEEGADGGGSLPTREESERLLQRIEEIADRSRAFLDNLPKQLAQAIEQLKEYEFMDNGARAMFDDLLKFLRQQGLDAFFHNFSKDLASVSPGQLDSLKDMLQGLNGLLEEHLDKGEPASRPFFDRFMQKYGQLFGVSPPASVEELVEALHQQMSQMNSLVKSLSPGLRRELSEALDSVFRDDGLKGELERFVSNLERMRPEDALSDGFNFRGDDPLGLGEALEIIRHLQNIEELERQMGMDQQGGGRLLDGVDPGLVRELLGEESYQEIERLKRIAEVLEDAGYIQRVGSRFELTPRGIRKIGHRALHEIFSYIRKDRLGSHFSNGIGSGSEHTEDTKKYEYGDPFDLHIRYSMMNAVRRSKAEGSMLGPGSPVRMTPDDFEIRQTELTSQATTVLMLDLSLSMAMRGNFVAAKKVALALDDLIRTQFPKDVLHIVGFSTYAREVKPEKLAHLSWDEFDPYTNIQHGLVMARKLLSKAQGYTKQIVMISDGEPTAHMEDGQIFLQYPPSPRTIQETLKEVKRCTRQDIKINTFMLERSPYLIEFVGQMTRINRGRVFYTSPDKLGEYILVDYLTNRRRQLV